MKIHSLFDSFDAGKSVSKTEPGKEYKGVKTLDMSKMNPVRAFFAKIFGVTVTVGGKEYLVGKESAARFLKDNANINVKSSDSKALVAGLTKYYNDEVKTKGEALVASKDTITMTPAELKLVLKAVGLNDKQLMNELKIGGTVESAKPIETKKGVKVDAIEGGVHVPISKKESLQLKKDDLIKAISKHANEIKSDNPDLKEVVDWLKDSIANKPTDLPEQPTTTKVNSASVSDIKKFKFDDEKVERKVEQLLEETPQMRAIVAGAKESPQKAMALIRNIAGGKKQDQDAFLNNPLGVMKDLKNDEAKALIHIIVAKAKGK